MTEVVRSIRRVTDTMGEISAASNEQSLGVAQVGEAVTQMDETTQQNAALVEQMTAAANSLRNQSHELVQVVWFFKLDRGGESRHVAGLRQARRPSHGSRMPACVSGAGPPVGLASFCCANLHLCKILAA